MTVRGEQLLLDSPAARPCHHTRVHHQHGTRQAYNQDGCRCLPCAEAASNYSDHRRRQMAYGRWAAFADGDPVREHIHNLMRAEGIGWKSVAARAGLSEPTLQRLLYGDHNTGGKPAVRVRQRTADKLLALSPRRARMPETPDLLTKESE